MARAGRPPPKVERGESWRLSRGTTFLPPCVEPCNVAPCHAALLCSFVPSCHSRLEPLLLEGDDPEDEGGKAEQPDSHVNRSDSHKQSGGGGAARTGASASTDIPEPSSPLFLAAAPSAARVAAKRRTLSFASTSPRSVAQLPLNTSPRSVAQLPLSLLGRRPSLGETVMLPLSLLRRRPSFDAGASGAEESDLAAYPPTTAGYASPTSSASDPFSRPPSASKWKRFVHRVASNQLAV